MRELFDKKGKRKEKRHEKKRETIFHMIRQKKGREICALCRWRSWFEVSTARRAVNDEGAQFSENAL